MLPPGLERLGLLLTPSGTGTVLLASRWLLLLGQDLGTHGLQPLLVEVLPEFAVGHSGTNSIAECTWGLSGTPNGAPDMHFAGSPASR